LAEACHLLLRARRDIGAELRPLLRVSSRDLYPPMGLAGHPPPRRHHRSPQPRRQTGPAEPCPAKP